MNGWIGHQDELLYSLNSTIYEVSSQDLKDYLDLV